MQAIPHALLIIILIVSSNYISMDCLEESSFNLELFEDLNIVVHFDYKHMDDI